MKPFLCGLAFLVALFMTLLSLVTFGLGIPSALAQGEAVVLSGRVTADGDGQPLANVHIVLVDNSTFDKFDVSHTDSSGYYTVTAAIEEQFPNLIPGTYYVYFKSNSAHLSEYYDDVDDIFDGSIFTLTAGSPISGIDAVLALGGMIRGNVTALNDNQPVAGAKLSLYRPVGGALENISLTDEFGAYTLTSIVTGTYKLGVDPSDANPYFISEYYPDKRLLADASPLSIVSGTIITDADFALALGGHIQGAVTSHLGLNVTPDIDVYNGSGQLVLNRLYGSLEPNNYLLTDLLPGSYRLYFRDALDGHRPEYYDNKTNLADATEVQVTAGQVTDNINVELTLTRTVKSLATSAGLSNSILLSLEYSTAPVYTNNGGQSWQQVPTTPWVPFGGDSPFVGLTVRNDAMSQVRMLVAADSAIGGFENGLYRSGDNGQTWYRQKFPFGSCVTFEQFFSQLVVSPVNPSKIYLLNNCVVGMSEIQNRLYRLFISSDAGLTWLENPPQVGPSSQGAEIVIVSPVLAGRVYAYGRFPSYGGFDWILSDDGGETWALSAFTMTHLALDATESEWLYGISPFADPYTEPRVGQLSEDGGKHWTNWGQQPCLFKPVPSADENPIQLMAHPSKSRMLFIRCQEGLYRSGNGGDTWIQLEQTPGQLLAADYGNPGRLLWAKDDGLWASTNDGESWQVIMPNYEYIVPIPQVPMFLPSVSANE